MIDEGDQDDDTVALLPPPLSARGSRRSGLVGRLYRTVYREPQDLKTALEGQLRMTRSSLRSRPSTIPDSQIEALVTQVLEAEESNTTLFLLLRLATEFQPFARCLAGKKDALERYFKAASSNEGLVLAECKPAKTDSRERKTAKHICISNNTFLDYLCGGRLPWSDGEDIVDSDDEEHHEGWVGRRLEVFFKCPSDECQPGRFFGGRIVARIQKMDGRRLIRVLYDDGEQRFYSSLCGKRIKWIK